MNSWRLQSLISKDGSRLAVYIIQTDEELLIAGNAVHCVLKDLQQL
jgi:acetate kinase